jgi:hypothetical protein
MPANAWTTVQRFLAAIATVFIARLYFAVTGWVSAIAWGVLIRQIVFYCCHNLLLGKTDNY